MESTTLAALPQQCTKPLGEPSKGSYLNRFIRGRYPYSLASHGSGGVRPGGLSHAPKLQWNAGWQLYRYRTSLSRSF